MRITENTLKQLVENFNNCHPELPNLYLYIDAYGKSVRDSIRNNIIVAGTTTECYNQFVAWVAGYATARRVFNLGKEPF